MCECNNVTRYGEEHQCILGSCRRHFIPADGIEIARLYDQIHDLNQLLSVFRRTRLREAASHPKSALKDVGIGLENLEHHDNVSPNSVQTLQLPLF